MTDKTEDHETEKPLDPAVLRVQQRLRGMMMWSRGIMLVGFAALFGVIFYKFYWAPQSVRQMDALSVSPASDPVAAIPMPEGGHITSSRVDGNRLVVTIDAAKAESILVIDLETMRTLRRLDLTKGN